MANVIKHKRGSGSDPVASDLVLGEVAIRTDTGKLFTKMDNGSVAEIAGGGSDIAINTLSSSSGTGGGSATFNGSAYRFTLSQPPSVSAQQLLVSINGVIQKPVAGTGQPSEGFSVDGTDIILGDAPATGSDFFILTFKSLGVSEPADNSVTSAKIVDGAIVNADINASAAIAGSKISPTFTSAISQSDSGGTSNAFATNIQINTNFPSISLNDTDSENDFHIQNQNGLFAIKDTDAAANRLTISSAGVTTIAGNLDVGAGLDVTGGITGTGDLTVDTNTLHVDSSNNRVGIGTTSPAGVLEIDAASTTDMIMLDVGGTNFARLGHNSASGTALLDVRSEGHFRILTGGNNERLRINSSGNLGIGTTSPSEKLTISSGNLAFIGGTNDAQYIKFGDSGDDDIGNIFYYHGNNNMVFTTNASEAMRINSSGNVGIGTTSPAVKLDVTGQMHVSTSIGIRTTSPQNNLHVHQTDSGSSVAQFTNSTTTIGSDGGFHVGLDSSEQGFFNLKENKPLVFEINGSERMRIDSSGRIGQYAPNFSAFNANADDFIINGSGDTGITINSGAATSTSEGNLVFAEGNGSGGTADAYRGAIKYKHGDDYMAFFTDVTERMRLRTSTGGLMINDDGSTRIGEPMLHVLHGGAGNNVASFFYNTTDNRDAVFIRHNGATVGASRTMIKFTNDQGNQAGKIECDRNSTAYLTSSDYRLKENEVLISDGITRLKTLKPYRFNFKDAPAITVDGFFAHEVTAVPEAITGTKDEVDSDNNILPQGIDQSKLVPLLVAALQEAIGRIEALEAK